MTADELKQARKALGLSQMALSRALGVDGRTVRRWEAGDSIIPPFLPLALEAVKYRQEKMK